MSMLMDYIQKAESFVEWSDEFVVDEQIRELLEIEKSLLPINRANAAQLHQRIDELVIYRDLGISKTLPTEPLSQRNDQGEPVFAIYSPLFDNMFFRLSYELRGSFDITWRVFNVTPGLPRFLRQYYLDMESHLKNKIRSKFFGLLRPVDSVMSSRFDGIIPREVGEKIKKAAALSWRKYDSDEDIPVFSDILMIGEASWSYLEERPALYADPIVVGIAHDTLYFIDSFDPTPAEQLWKDMGKSTLE